MPRRITARRQIGAALEALDQAERSLGWSPQDGGELITLMKQTRLRLLSMYIVSGWTLPPKLARYTETLNRLGAAKNASTDDEAGNKA